MAIDEKTRKAICEEADKLWPKYAPHDRYSDMDLYSEVLRECEEVWEGKTENHRHFTVTTIVVQVGERFFMTDKGGGSEYVDRGYEPYLDGICEVEPYEVVTIEYRGVQ